MKRDELLQSLIEIGNIHSQRLEKALQHISHLEPFQPLTINNVTDEELSFVEMMTTRFAKLQDLLGSKIFPLLLQILQESSEEESYLDRLHKLEKLGILPSANEWSTMRELRNHITHEYPDNPELMAANLNKACQHSRFLLAFWDTLKGKIQKLL